MAHTVCLLLLSIAIAGGLVSAYDPSIDARDIADALAIGQSRIESQRLRFHQPYRIQVNRAPIDYIEVVTPFRRVVLAAETRARAGDRGFGQREALAVLADGGGRIQLFVDMTFHPLNTFLGVPPYGMALVASGGAVAPVVPREIERIPRYGPRLEGTSPTSPLPQAPAGSQPLLGGTLIAAFDGSLLNPDGVYDAVITESGKELARARIDLRVIR